MAARLKVTQIKSVISEKQPQRDTLRSLGLKRIGDVVVRAHITDVRTGQLKAAGQGVYLPVWGRGTATIRLAPR